MSTELQAYHDMARSLLQRTLPSADRISFPPAGRGYLVVSLFQGRDEHTFRLRREGDRWFLREWLRNKELQSGQSKPNSHFQDLIASLIGRPMVTVNEMRCPEQQKRLFGKIIVQSFDPALKMVQIEFACSECRRLTRKLVMHYYDGTGAFIKTEEVGPWVPRESRRPWYESPSGHRSPNGSRPEEPLVGASTTNTKGS